MEDYCPHMDVPLVYSGCTICSGKELARQYNWHKPFVILNSTRGEVLKMSPVVWKPSTRCGCPNAKLLHISGNWRYSDVEEAVQTDVLVIEFAPSQKHLISKAVLHTAWKSGVGLQLRALRGPKS